ncbi:MAG: TAXI family TRAP transporter solute-binding subunit [Alphaproteobacteria bacterium]|nr:TAXI family TRAP transporter solute-binding subunit [Alphaproteobacteria bacterium]
MPSRRTLAALSLGCVFMLAAMPGTGLAQDSQRSMLQLTTGGVTGSFYLIGAPISNYVNNNSGRLRLTPSTSGGGYENLRRVNSGQAQLGMATPDAMFEGWNGEKPFTAQMRNWRVIGQVVPPMANHLVVLDDPKINTLSDLKGKNVAIGAPGSAAATGLQRLLTVTGLLSQMKAQMLPHQDYPDMLVDKRVDAITRLGTIPAGTVEEIAAQRKIKLVDMSAEMEKSGFFKKYPFYQPIKIAAGTYPGQNKDVTVFGSNGFLIAHKDVPDDVIYEFTKLTYSEPGTRHVTMAFKSHGLNAKSPLTGNPGPVHPGAAKYWREQGIPIPDPVLK